MIRCVPDEGRVGAGAKDASYTALGFRYVATMRVLAPDSAPFRREMWSDGRDTSLTVGPSGLSGEETAFHTVGANGIIVRTFALDATDAKNLPSNLGLSASGLHDEALVEAPVEALYVRHVARVAEWVPGEKWPLLTLDDELRLALRTSTLLAATGTNAGRWLLRLAGGILAGIVGFGLGLCGLPPQNGWLITGGVVSAVSAVALWALITRRWTPGPSIPPTAPGSWPAPIAFSRALEAELARGPVLRSED